MIKSTEPDFDAILARIKGETYKTRFLVYFRDGLIPIETSEIAYFYSEDSVTFLMCDDNKKFILNETLDNIEKQLSPKDFFRANRKFIVAAKSITKVELYFNQKLVIKVKPETDQQIIVSKLKATPFKNWLNS